MLRLKFSLTNFLLCFLSEFIGTAILVFFCCITCTKYGNMEISNFQISLNTGLAIMVIVQIFGGISGAYVNPSLTLAALINKLITWQMAIVYFIAQMLGGIVGFGLLKIVIPYQAFESNDVDNLIKPNSCLTLPGPDVTILQAFLIEFIMTIILVLFCCTFWDPRFSKYQETIPLKIGLCVAILVNSAGPFTGASLNSARSFGPALWNLYFEYNWIYWVSQLSGAFLAALFYKTVFRKDVNLDDDVETHSK